MDLFAPRTYATDELANVARERQALLQNQLADVPPEVPRGYVPSGRTESNTLPILLAFGLGGLVVALGFAYAVDWVALGTVHFFLDVGGCLVPILGAALIAHFAAPLVIPTITGAVVAAGGASARCRSPETGRRAGWIVAVVAVVATIWWGQRIPAGVMGEISPVVDGLATSGVWGVIVGIPTALVSWVVLAKGGLIYLGILGVLALLIVPVMAEGAGDEPFCEATGTYMKEQLLGRYSLEQIGQLLHGLFGGVPGALGMLRSQPLDADPDAKVARLDLKLWSGKGLATNLVEVQAHFFRNGKDKVESRVFSEMFSRDQVDALAAELGVEIKEPEGLS